MEEITTVGLARLPLDLLVGQFADTKARIDAVTADLRRGAEADEVARRLQTMPGIGPITASVLAATLPDVPTFRSARDLSAWLGLTPKAHSSGDKARLGSISKMGNRYIRRLLYLGAMGVIAKRRKSDPGEDWLGGMIRAKPLKLVAIALANRMARQVWAMLRTGEAWRAA
jgi:transposase